ncbi:MAG: msrB [Sphingobacteriales bacterium]|nr:msrB [Sphingobacteriales bacterium]
MIRLNILSSNNIKLHKVLLVPFFLILLCGCQNRENTSSKKYPAYNTDEQWKKVLSPNAYEIMVEGGTEPAFNNSYYNEHDTGTYVSAATGEPLFSSEDKFESGTGWPSFTKPIKQDFITIKKDNSFGIERDEVVETKTGLHLGHVFDDGPEDKGGKRYYINSAALKFIEYKK